MGIASLIISIISISISAIVTGIPFYRKYMEKKTRIALIACNGIVRDDTISIVVNYVNKNWQNAIIVKGCIILSRSGFSNEFTKTNHACSCKTFEPIVLQERMHASAKLEYSLSDLRGVDFPSVDVWINTEYVDCQGQKMSDSSKIGTLRISRIGTLMVSIDSVTHELQRKKVIMSIEL